LINDTEVTNKTSIIDRIRTACMPFNLTQSRGWGQVLRCLSDPPVIGLRLVINEDLTISGNEKMPICCCPAAARVFGPNGATSCGIGWIEGIPNKVRLFTAESILDSSASKSMLTFLENDISNAFLQNLLGTTIP